MGGGCALVGVVRVKNEIYTADTVQQLRAIVERLERAEGAPRSNRAKKIPTGCKPCRDNFG